MKLSKILKITAVMLTISFTPINHAADMDADSVIKYRKGVMNAVKGHNNAVKLIASGKVTYTNQLNNHINSLENLINEIEHLFPEGSDFGKTSAKAAVWDSPEKFSEAIQSSKDAIANVKTAAAGGDLAKTSAALKKFGRTCGGCHKKFKSRD